VDFDDELKHLLESELQGLHPVGYTPMADDFEIAEDCDLWISHIRHLAYAAIARQWQRGRLAADHDMRPGEMRTEACFIDSKELAPKQSNSADIKVWQSNQECLAARQSRSGRMTPLDVLQRDFGLRDLAIQIIQVVAAPHLYGSIARLYAIIRGNDKRPLCDEILVSEVLKVNLADVAIELDAQSPLRYFGLIDVFGKRPSAGLRVDDVLLRIINNQSTDSALPLGLSTRFSDRDITELHLPPTTRLQALRFLSVRRRRQARLVLRGRIGCGRRTMLAALAARAGRSIGFIDAAMFPKQDGLFVGHLAIALRACVFLGWVPCIGSIETQLASGDEAMKRDMLKLFENHPGPLALRLPAETQVPLSPGFFCADIPVSTTTDREVLWKQALDRYAIPVVDTEELASRNRIGTGIIYQVCHDVAFGSSVATQTSPSQDQWQQAIEATVAQHLDNRLSASAQHITRLARWSDVVLPSDIVDSLLEMTARVRHRRSVFESWNFDQTITSARGITALFAGTPGTGKTMVAGVLARELGLELYRVDLSKISSKWIGETEKNLAALFDAAEDGQVLLLFDEADSLFSKRTEVKNSTDRHANMQVNYLLQRLDTFEGVAILTSNFGTSIDPAFKRRLTYRITFPFPDEVMRAQMWNAMLPADLPRDNDINVQALADQFRMSGGFIRNAVLRAAFIAAQLGSSLSHKLLLAAIHAEYKAIGKLTHSGTLE
jgi:DNA replication protein DnaC